MTLQRLAIAIGAALSIEACGGGDDKGPNEPITAWADRSDYALVASRSCGEIEKQYFGAQGTACWSAKAHHEQEPRGSRMFPRVAITVATYATESEAKQRIARFHDVPKGLVGEPELLYPLRAGFRVGDRVVIITTDALAFERDANRAARELATAMGGTELTCWRACD